MKTRFLLFSIILVPLHVAFTQSTNSLVNPATNGPALPSLDAGVTNDPTTLAPPPPFTTELSRTFTAPYLEPFEPKPNEMTLGNLHTGGIAIEAWKTGQPLKLINPFDPPANSSPEDNVVRDPFSGRVNGLSVFTIRF